MRKLAIRENGNAETEEPVLTPEQISVRDALAVTIFKISSVSHALKDCKRRNNITRKLFRGLSILNGVKSDD